MKKNMAISFDDEKVGNDVGFVWKSMDLLLSL